VTVVNFTAGATQTRLIKSRTRWGLRNFEIDDRQLERFGFGRGVDHAEQHSGLAESDDVKGDTL
jgi:hypothetical protein